MSDESVVYFAAGRDAIKIGFTRNLKSRFQVLQTASADELTLLGFISGASTVERALHARLAAFRRKGEWFDDCEAVRAAINESCGRDVFTKPIPVVEPVPEDMDLEVIQNAKERLIDFVNFCTGPEGASSPSALLAALPIPHKHLVLAAMRHAESWFEEHVRTFLAADPGSEEYTISFKRSLAFAEQLECHVEMICGTEFKHLLTAWPKAERRCEHFETNF